MRVSWQQLNPKYLGLSGTLLFLFGSLFGFIGFPRILESQIASNLALKKGSEIRAMWSKIPIPLEFKAYIFNVTNPMDVQKGGKPALAEVGPYVYLEYKDKLDFEDHNEDDTVSFNPRDTWYFSSQKSGALTGDEPITIPHIAMLVMALAAERERPVVLKLINKAIPSLFENPSSMFITTTARRLLFEGIPLYCNATDFSSKAICSELRKRGEFGSLGDDVLSFSLFGKKNATAGGRMRVKRGIKNIKQLGEVVEYMGQEKLSVWSGDPCNTLTGSDSTIYPPFLTTGDYVTAFSPELFQTKPLSSQDVARAVAVIDDERSLRYAAATIGASYTTVQEAVKRFRETQSYSRRPDSGRKRKTSARDYRFLVSQVLRNRHTTAVEARNRLQHVRDVNVSERAVRRRLGEQNLQSRRPATGPDLTREHRADRLQFARQHPQWTVQQWSSVLFSDESRFSLKSPDGTERGMHIVCKDAIRWRFRDGVGRHLHGGPNGMVIVENGGLNAHRYINEILVDHVVPFAAFIGDDFMFMHDSARPHAARCVSQYLDELEIVCLNWAARSPDLNSIEISGIGFAAYHTGNITYKGIKAYTYSADFGDAASDPEMACYCPSEKSFCKKGMLDLTSCMGAPIIVSLPHFYLADREYQTGVLGINASKEKHEIFSIFEPLTSTPLMAHRRVQLSLPLHSIDSIDLMKQAPTVLLPIIWIEERKRKESLPI
ncbi:sensory neuron membrane protein 1-like [Periplaneta americana]|uniref:sensory neuron membrane protein 1-like n=1 Tax=Periplaneta americana TaxID=6978 RepID=UPI0037E9B590